MSPKAQAARTIDLPETWLALQSKLIDDKERFWLLAIIDDQERDEWWVTESTGRLSPGFYSRKNTRSQKLETSTCMPLLKTRIPVREELTDIVLRWKNLSFTTCYEVRLFIPFDV